MSKAAQNFPVTLDPAASPQVWATLLDVMPHAVWLVDVSDLHIVAVNLAATQLLGAPEEELLGRPVFDFAITPEDCVFWRETAGADTGPLVSESLVRRVDGNVVPVTRRVSRIFSATGTALYVVALEDRRLRVERERELEVAVTELQATIESLSDGVLVTDLHGRIRNFNHRFAAIWALPDAVLARRDDAAVFDWMRASVVEPVRYTRRLAAISDSTLMRANDLLTLRSGRVIERVTAPQCSRDQPIGRVFTFREGASAGRESPSTV